MPSRTSSTELRLRLALPADIGSIAAIENEQFSRPWSPQAIAAEISFPTARIYLAESLLDGALWGYSVIRRIGPTAELLRIAVAESRKRRRVAQALMEKTIAELRLEGVQEILLEVRQGNLAARSLYEKYSFLCQGTRPGYYGFPDEDACLYRLIL